MHESHACRSKTIDVTHAGQFLTSDSQIRTTYFLTKQQLCKFNLILTGIANMFVPLAANIQIMYISFNVRIE